VLLSSPKCFHNLILLVGAKKVSMQHNYPVASVSSAACHMCLGCVKKSCLKPYIPLKLLAVTGAIYLFFMVVVMTWVSRADRGIGRR
jgi:hypothetical protein